jgi:hypothetical protein
MYKVETPLLQLSSPAKPNDLRCLLLPQQFAVMHLFPGNMEALYVESV